MKMTIVARPIGILVGWMQLIPASLVALLGRFAIAVVFWNSGQTKVEGLAINLLNGQFTLGWPRISDSALMLFQYEYNLPLIPPSHAASLAAFAEHLFPLLLFVGLATRFSAFALFIMTLIIQIFVYPEAYVVHATWATIMLMLMVRGPGVISLDHWLARRYRMKASPV